MKHTLFSTTALTVLISLGSGTVLFPDRAFAHQDQSYMIYPCPGGGQGMMMGPGMMGPGMTGPGMMGPGMTGPGMMGPGMMGPGWGGQGMYGRMAPPQDLTVSDVQTMLERYLQWQGNPHLKEGDVKEKDKDTITAEIVTADGSLVQRMEVDRHTGWMKQVP